MQTNAPVPIESRALGTLSYIRASIDAAGSLAVPGAAGIVMGTLGTAAAVVASLPAFRSRWIEIWMVAAVAAFLVGGGLVIRQSTRRRGVLSSPIRKFLLCLCPALLAGAVLTFTLWRAGTEHLIPGMWLLLYGCAVISASTVTCAPNSRLIGSMGGIFAGLGLIALGAPAASHTLILGFGFGVLHLIFGILIGHMNHGYADEQ
ncbi:MAG TPA: hypothetical protein VFS52_02800 [Steroidobacteraceae bacterium]|jgi:hypothetical protein|nr:hypothetical protein [Steroidobacteraceae bacterium]